MGDWGAYLDEYMIDKEQSGGHCYAAALAYKTGGGFYAAAPVAGDAGWAFVHKDPHEENIMQEDGETVKKIKIDEAENLTKTVTDGKAPPSGLWLGGLKYTVTQAKEEESGENTFYWIFANRPKKGVNIFCTDTTVVAGFYDEEKGQSAGNCKRVTLAFAEYMAGGSMVSVSAAAVPTCSGPVAAPVVPKCSGSAAAPVVPPCSAGPVTAKENQDPFLSKLVSAVGAAGAYAATRGEEIGKVTRGLGETAKGVAEATKNKDQEYKLTETVSKGVAQGLSAASILGGNLRQALSGAGKQAQPEPETHS